MTDDLLQKKFTELSEHYDNLAMQYGDSHHAVQQSSVETQHKRLQVLLEIEGNLKFAKVLDFGCGTGELLTLLQSQGFEGEYVGYDLSPKLLEIAQQKFPKTRFEQRDVLKKPPNELFDYVFISGVFNNDIGVNQRFLKDTITTLFPLAQKGLAFNCLSTYVDFQSDGLYYFNPLELFQFCKEHLSTNVCLRHEYEIKEGVIPFEFSLYVYASPHKPIASL